MQPYQEASQEIRRQGEMPLKIAKGVAGAGATVGATALGAGIGRVLPFLSKYVPQDLAIKGLNKVDPRFGKFIQTALDAGESFEGAKEFIGSKIEEQQKAEAPAKQGKNIIEQESPELHTFLDQEIRKGRKPIEAGAVAQVDKRFSDVIKKLMKAHKTPWSSIIESVFGNGEMAHPNQQQQQPSQQTQPQQGQQSGQGLDPMVAQILQQGNAIMQKFRGQ